MEEEDLTLSQPFIFLGYITSIETVVDPSGHYISIQLNAFLERLNDMGYLPTASFYNVPVQDQVKINRYCPLLLQNLRLGNYLQHVPVFHDLEQIYFYSLFNIGDTQYSILKKLADQFSRLVFQRRSGELYIIQMYNEELKDRFKTIQWETIQSKATGIQHNIDYSKIPYEFILSYTNAPLLNNSLTAATYTLVNAPNKDTVFNSVQGKTIEFPSNATLSNTFSYKQVKNVQSNAVNVSIKSPQQNNQNSTLLTNLMKLQVLQEAYQYLPNTHTISLTIPLTQEFYQLDIGDIVHIPDNTANTNANNINNDALGKFKDLWVISTINIQVLNARINLTLMPIQHTTPALQLTNSSAIQTQ